MDDLKLLVGDGELDEQWKVGLVKESLEVTQGGLHFFRRWRNEDGSEFPSVLGRDPHGQHLALRLSNLPLLDSSGRRAAFNRR